MTTVARILDVVSWVLVVAVGTVVFFTIPAFVLGSGLLSLKYLLFVVGFLYFGIGSWILWLRSRRRPSRWFDRSFGVDPDQEFWFERRLWNHFPLAHRWLPPRERVDRSVKVFLTGMVILLVSYLMETVLGITI